MSELDGSAGIDARLAKWIDVRNKAIRIRNNAGVKVVRIDSDVVVTEVRGDHDTYTVELYRQDPWSFAISIWTCSCPWGDWAFKRQVTYVGRLCSHALASLYEVQSLENRKDSPNYRWDEGESRPYWVTQPSKPRRSSTLRQREEFAAVQNQSTMRWHAADLAAEHTGFGMTTLCGTVGDGERSSTTESGWTQADLIGIDDHITAGSQWVECVKCEKKLAVMRGVSEEMYEKRRQAEERWGKKAGKSNAPFGVIFDGPEKVYVGVNHLVPLDFSEEMLTRLKQIGDEHGYWYEGAGGDVEPNAEMFGDESAYEGSWDDAYVESIEDTPSEFFLLFVNVEVNKIVEKIVFPDTTIFESILDGYEEDGEQKYLYYLPDVVPDEDLLTEYLESISDDGNDFLEMSKVEATEENVQEFCDKGEEACWEDWEDPHTPAALVTKSANDRRDKFLLDAGSGVYFTGSGHLLTLLQADDSLEMVGGEEIDE